MATIGSTTGRSRIFISYRHEDSELASARIADDLRRYFGQPQVFQDFASIDPGADFVEAVDQGLNTCAAVLVVIGPDWLNAADKQGRRRLELPDDWVRHEVAESLKRSSVRVFPVLVGDAQMPDAAELPEPLKPLSRRQAFPLTVRHWSNDLAQLIEHLARVPGLDGSVAVGATPTMDRTPETRASSNATTRTSGDAPRAAAAPSRSDATGGGHRITWKPIAAVGVVLIASLIFLILQEFRVPKLENPQAPPQDGGGRQPDSSTSVSNRPGGTQPGYDGKHPGRTTRPARPTTNGPDCEQCPKMVTVPAGSFEMGSPDTEPGRSDDEGPRHKVTIAQPFAVGKYEVTFQEWDACVAAGGCSYSPQDEGWGRGNQPVINVSWNDAQDYVKWLSSKTQKTYRLLSEAEWEYAARAGSATRYPWGDELGTGRANVVGPYLSSGSEWSKKQAAPVGKFAPNSFGLYDMIGNVFELVQDCASANYVGAPADGSAWRKPDCDRVVVRGGSWRYWQGGGRAAYRHTVNPDERFKDVGFRVARTL